MATQELYKLHDLTKGLLRGEVEDLAEILPILQDIKANEPHLFDKLLKLLAEYKSSLAERIVDSSQRVLDFDK